MEILRDSVILGAVIVAVPALAIGISALVDRVDAFFRRKD
jgi:hypothetical protein